MAQHPSTESRLLPPSVAEKLPKLYSQEALGLDAIAVVKMFLPGTAATWYVSEFDPEDKLLFGYVCLADCQNAELGYTSLDELEAVRAGGIFPVERDLHWQPISLRVVMAACDKGEHL